MSYRELRGNIFASKAQAIVNTVNCVGVMGKGVALEFRRRFPRMFEEYRKVCAEKTLRPGQILPYRKERPWILNFAVKNDWRHPSRMEWVESCLRKFSESYVQLGIRSVAMPWIGAMNGRLPWDKVHAMMRSYLSDLSDVDVEVIEYDADAPDPLFEALRIVAAEMTPTDFGHQSEMGVSAAALIIRALRANEAKNMAALVALDGLGEKSVDRLYAFLRRSDKKVTPVEQPYLM